MSHRKKLVIAIAVLFVAAIAAYSVFDMSYGSPTPIVQNPEDIQVIFVLFGEEDVTELVDREALVQLLLKYSCRKVPAKYYNELMASRKAEIILGYKNRPLHLFFGSINICYESGNKGWKEIIDADKLLDEIKGLIK